jgi:hypothetical protein
MDGRAASQTITDKIPALLTKNWDLFVLSAITGSQDKEIAHRRLIAIGPSALRFDLRHWVANRLGRGFLYRLIITVIGICLLPFIVAERALVGLSSQWSWAILSSLYGLYWVKKYNINLIYSTGGAWSAHLSGWIIKKIFRLTWIVEFHDPMVERSHSDTDKTDPRERKAKQLIERICCRDADVLWWFTETALEDARLRNKTHSNKLFNLLPGARPPEKLIKYKRGKKIRFAHFGSLSKTRSLGSFIDTIFELLKNQPELTNILEIHIYGSDTDTLSKQKIRKYNLGDYVFEHGRIEKDHRTGTSGRDQIMTLMQQFDFLILTHGANSNSESYIPSKIYEYWWARRPILAIINNNQQLRAIILSIHPKNTVIETLASDCEYYAKIESAIGLWRAGAFDEFAPQSAPATPDNAVDLITEMLAKKTRFYDEASHDAI